MTDNRMWEEAQRQRELRDRERRFVEEQEARREQCRRDAAQSELEEYLRQRGQRYQDLTGETPSRATLARWRDEYVDEQELVRQAEREQQREGFEPVY
jgi:hypothetical protein